MAINPGSEDLYKRIAATLVQRKQTPGQASGLPTSSFAGGPVGAVEGEGSPEQWSLGQSIIDVLSSGTYLTAGIGRKLGQNISSMAEGGLAGTGATLDLFNPFSTLSSGIQGIADRRTWSDNLKDAGADEGVAAGAGLALDIALDPLWLVPGGAIASGVKGVAKGAALASGASKSGVKLTPAAIEKARAATADFSRPLLTDNLVTTKTGVEVNPAVQDFFPETGQRIPIYSAEGLSNLIQGVKNATVDEYAKWGATRAANKAAKAARKNPTAEINTEVAETVPFDQGSEGILAQLVKPISVVDETKPVGEQAAKVIEDVTEKAENGRTIKDFEKDADAVPETVQASIENQSVRQFARDQVEPAKNTYMQTRNMPVQKIDFDAVDVSPLAGKIADFYDKAPNDVTNPEVIRAYEALKSEVREQYDYMTNELGIRVEFVRDADPYNVTRADGTTFPSPKEMMRDVTENKRLLVRDSAPDYEQFGPHPLLSAEDNNLFRAVHDFFGHAGSGRGFLADGEEAAWISHSQMFTPLARRAMTTETRGQNSWVNKYGRDPETGELRFAEQKAFLLPEEFVLTPTEFSALERRVGATNQFIGVKTNALVEYADQLLEDLAMVWSPIKASKMYSADQIKQLRAKYEEITAAGKFSPQSPESRETLRLFGELRKYMLTPSRYASVTRQPGSNSVVDLLAMAEIALKVEDPRRQEAGQRALAAMRTLLDEPVDATDLLESALKLENRVINDPKPFKPTVWGTEAKTGAVTKPPFSIDKLRQYFADDELLRDEEALAIAFGTKKAKAGSPAAAKLATQQQIIWENFRARNHDILAEVVEREKNEWFAANSIANSSFFTKMADGTVVGQGALPASIPVGTIYTLNGRPMTSLAALLDNLGKVINRPGAQMGGLPATQITGTATRIAPEVIETQTRTVTRGGRQVEEVEQLSRGEALVTEEGARFNAFEVSGAISIPERKRIQAAMKRRGREIEMDTYPLAVQSWILDKIDDLTSKVTKEGIVDSRLVDEALDVETITTRLWDEVPFLKSRADARKMATLGPEALVQLSKAPARRYFVDAEFDRLIGAPDVSGIQRSASGTGSRAEKKIVARDPESGVPIDKNGNPVPEAEAEVVGGTQYRILAEGGKAYTGRLSSRAGSQAAPQTGTGAQQLAGLQAIRTTLGSLTEAITAKELVTSKEQAALLSSVLNTLNIRVAPNATPAKIFDQFQKEALPRFEEIVSRIESAAKLESVAYQAKSIFKMVDEQNISLMKAIEEIDPSEIQRQSVKFTDDAISLVDDTCRARTQGTVTYANSILNQVLGGLNG